MEKQDNEEELFNSKTLSYLDILSDLMYSRPAIFILGILMTSTGLSIFQKFQERNLEKNTREEVVRIIGSDGVDLIGRITYEDLNKNGQFDFGDRLVGIETVPFQTKHLSE